MGRKDINKKVVIRRAALIVACFLVTIFLLIGIYSVIYANKVLPNQYLGSENLGGKNKASLSDEIKTKTDQIANSTITLTDSDQNKEYKINLVEIGLNYDSDGTTQELWSPGHSRNVFQAILEEIRAIFVKTKHYAVFSLNEESLEKKVSQIATELDQPEKDYSIIYKNSQFELTPERADGKKIDQVAVVNKVKNEIQNAKVENFSFALQVFHPQVDSTKAQAELDKANKIISAGNLTLKYDGQDFKVDIDTIGGFISSKTNKDDLDLILNEDRTRKYVQSLATGINVDSINAKLTIVNGKVTVFQNSVEGRTLDETQTVSDIGNALFSRIQSDTASIDPNTINLKVATKKPDVSNSDINSLGISELVGTATTSFANSPANRIHNIQIGASTINGTLLGPGEEFSTLARLGTVDSSTGYLEELVIKDNKTIPEFGGGLCQVSSTLFRSAFNAGVKITERQNHAYRVSYYEPPIGMDATIYDPSPDFKFINNYKNHLLIQSRIVGTKLSFDFYGTKDNRKIEISTPVMGNVVDPPPPVYTQTDTLAPGETKQTGKAHQGATASFHYKVSDSAGLVLQDKTFTSVYVAIPEQWLVGAQPIAPPTTCADGQQDGDETGLDCGGSCTPCAQ